MLGKDIKAAIDKELKMEMEHFKAIYFTL